MRLSSLAYAAILLVAAILLPAIHAAQHSSGGGGSSGGAGSHGSSGAFSSSSASSGSSHSSGGSSFHSAGGSAASPHTTSSSSGGASKGLSTKAGVGGDKKSSRSFFHPFRKTKPVENVDFRTSGTLQERARCGLSAGSAGVCRADSNLCDWAIVEWLGVRIAGAVPRLQRFGVKGRGSATTHGRAK